MTPPLKYQRRRGPHAKKAILFRLCITISSLLVLGCTLILIIPSFRQDTINIEESHGSSFSNAATNRDRTTTEKNDRFESTAETVSHDWDLYTVGDFWSELECAELFTKHRPVHSQPVWVDARRTYAKIVGSAASTVGNTDAPYNAFLVEGIEAKQAGGKGRGIFTNEDIPAGVLMYDFRRTAQFRDGQDYRRFIMSIPTGVACDVLQWAYVQYIGAAPANGEEDERKNLRIMVDLDEGSFCNNGGRSDANFGYINGKVEPIYNGVRPLYSKRKISAGEELLCNYGEFAVNKWEYFGL